MRNQVYSNDDVVHNGETIEDILKSLPPVTPEIEFDRNITGHSLVSVRRPKP
jgi:hypothetical protein